MRCISLKNLEILAEIALIFTDSDSFDKQIQKSMSIIGKYLKLSRVYVFLNDENGQTTNNEYEWCNQGITPEINNQKNIPIVPSWNFILKEDGVIVDDIKQLPQDIYNVLEPQNILSILIYPMIIKGKIRGFIGFDECIKKRTWKKTELYIAKTFAGIVSGSYERASMYDRLKRKKTNFQTFFNSIEDFFFICNYDSSIIYVNNSVINKLGYSAEEVKKLTILDLHPAAKRKEAAEILQKMIEGKLKYCNVEIESKYGEIFIVESRIWFGVWNDKECIFGISKDMTKEHEALQKFTKIFNINPIPMAISNKDGEFIQINSALTAVLGYEENDILGKKPSDLNLIVDREKHRKAIERLLKGEKLINLGLDIRCKDGSLKNALLFSEIIDNEGLKNVLTVMIDETENNLLQSSLDEERIRLENIIHGTGVGTWEWNIKTGETLFNDYWAYMLGYTLSELEPITIKTWMNLTHPDDLLKSKALLEKHFKGELDYYKCEIRLKHKSGEWIWVLDSGSVVEWDDDDQPLKMFGTHVDINVIKKAEETVKELSVRDPLTNIYNRRYVFERMEELGEIYKRSGLIFSVAILDIDKFKFINDNFGHQAGDYVIKEFTKIISDNMRSTDVLGRLGGEEFIVVAVDSNKNSTATLIERILHDVRERLFEFHEFGINCTFSAGVADVTEFEKEKFSIEKLIEKADNRMYGAKNTGRNRILLEDLIYE